MPELPEVETTKNGLIPFIVNAKVINVKINFPKLRWEIPTHIPLSINNKTLKSIQRRGKYLLFEFPSGILIIHLGMSGSISLSHPNTPLQKHDHFEIYFDNNLVMRLNDPRRFGCVLFSTDGTHKLLDNLGVEPLTDELSAEYLFNTSRGKTRNIKSFIMDSKIVVGIGNIYACETLFLSQISPFSISEQLSLDDYSLLSVNIKTILQKSINSGGTTLNDFSKVDGNPGYFQQSLFVYGREGSPCSKCQTTILKQIQNQRSTFFCPNCQG